MNHPASSLPPNKTGLIAWFVHNKVAANILMLLLVIGGIVSIKSMRTETFPSIDPRLIRITVAYPGATPYEVADSITGRVEEALSGINGVKRIASTASEGVGGINVELEDFADEDNVYNEVETAVNSLIDFPPDDAERPIISKIKVIPNVLTLALHGDVPEATIKYWADNIDDELKTIPGVAQTNVSGIRDYQISIEVPQNQLEKYNLTISDIGAAISQFSSDIPAGTVESRRGDILLRVQEKASNKTEFSRIPIVRQPDGSTLRLGEIAHVIDGFSDTNILSRFNGERAVFIEVKRADTGDTLSVAASVKAYLNTVSLPNDLRLSMLQDETVSLTDRINLMLRNGVLGFALVFIILLLFLDLKLAFWVSAAIPISFLGGLMIINAMGLSLNMISLFALIVVLGIVVDDGIVTGESIFAAQENAKDNSTHSVIEGVKKVFAPVTIGVGTTMAAFAPLTFSTGTLGQIIQVIPIVVIAILFVSLIEAYFILPAHLSHPGRWSRGVIADTRDKTTRLLFSFIDNKLIPLARFAITWRYATIALFLGIAIVTFGMLKGGIVRFVFFPQVEGDQIMIDVTLNQGTPFNDTRAAILQIERAAIEVRDTIIEQTQRDAFANIAVSVGQMSNQIGPGNTSAAQAANNIGQVKVQLTPSDSRDISSADIEKRIRNRVGSITNLDKINYISSPIGGGEDIKIDVSHASDALLLEASEKLKNRILDIQGTMEVADSFKKGKVEYVFSLNEKGLASGLTPATLGQALRTAFFGLEIQRFQRGKSEVIVYVRYPKDQREDINRVRNLRVALPSGEKAELDAIANINTQRGFSQIQSVNGKRVVSVTADVDLSVATPMDVISVIQNDIIPELQSRYTGLTLKFEGESREQSEDLKSLTKNMLIAMLIIYMLLGAQLRSYSQPIIIMAAIPFGVVGAILGHFVLGHDLTFISLFGIVALAGVVVNDSVVLVDYLNSHKRQNAEHNAAIIDSAIAAIARRFRPVLLTTLSTCLGLLPMLLETSMQAQFLIPMVISLTTGILFSTAVIIFLLPCMIVISHDVKSLIKKLNPV